MMRRDVFIAIAVFVALMIILAVLGWTGYERWSDLSH